MGVCMYVGAYVYMYTYCILCVCVHAHSCICEWCRVLTIWSDSDTCISYCVPLHAAPLDPLDERPTLKDLNEKVIVRVAGKWFTTGLQLDMTSDTLDAIKTPNGSNREHCLEMFKCWLAGEQGCGDLPRTWSSVLHAVENSCGSEVCQEIMERLHKGT